jgi:hypothetical protein
MDGLVLILHPLYYLNKKRRERMFFFPVLFRCQKINTSKRKTAPGGKNQHLIQLLCTKIFKTGGAPEILYCYCYWGLKVHGFDKATK